MKFDLKTLEKGSIPKDLLEIPQPPKKLYLAGELPPEGTVYLAVVGSRKCTTYGRDACRKLISGLKGYPIAIVSGLAVGIDALSHETALDTGLFTVAFPGSGISESVLSYHPNIKLMKRILESGGCLISEFEPDFKATQWSFPMRNRLVAGISRAALIIEAEEKSGTLITARMALDYNREVLAVPGPITSANSKGTNRLIRGGATPITSSLDILEALGFKVDDSSKQARLFEDLSSDEKKVFEILREPMPRDELLKKLKMPIQDANALLSIMEIKELIKEELGEMRLY
jgi:DNA processing protein